MSTPGASDAKIAAALVASKLDYDFRDLSNLETAVRLPDRSDTYDREADDGNRTLARIGREAAQLAASMEALKHGESREAASAVIDSSSARADRLHAAKNMGLPELLVRSPRQPDTEISSRVLDKSIFAIAGAVCVDSDGDVSSVSRSIDDMVTPNSSRRLRSHSLPPSSETGSVESRPDLPKRAVTLRRPPKPTLPPLDEYIKREEHNCERWSVTDPREGLESLENQSATGRSLSDHDRFTQRLLFFAFGSQEAILWLNDVVRQYSSGSYTHTEMTLDTRAHFDQIQKLSAQSGLFILLRRLHIYLFYQSLDESVRQPLQDFVPGNGLRPGVAGNPRNRAQAALVEAVLASLCPHATNDSEEALLRSRIKVVCKQAVNLDCLVRHWGFGALALFKGSSSPTYSDCELSISDKMLGDIAFEKFRLIVSNLNRVKGPLFCAMARTLEPLLEAIIQGRALPLNPPMNNKALFLDIPRDLPQYTEQAQRIVMS